VEKRKLNQINLLINLCSLIMFDVFFNKLCVQNNKTQQLTENELSYKIIGAALEVHRNL